MMAISHGVAIGRCRRFLQIAEVLELRGPQRRRLAGRIAGIPVGGHVADRRSDRGDHGEGVPVGVVDQRLLFEQGVDDGVQRFFLLHRVAIVGRRNLRPAGDDSPPRGVDTLETPPILLSDNRGCDADERRPGTTHRTDFLPHQRDSRRRSTRDRSRHARQRLQGVPQGARWQLRGAGRRGRRCGDDQLDRRAARDPRPGSSWSTTPCVAADHTTTTASSRSTR